jgi:hypothetical protein
MTIFGRIQYPRKALIISPVSKIIPVNQSNKKKLIFPVDEALHISQLPFKVTVPAMLTIAREVCNSKSYEEAELNLKKQTNIHINDDSIRKITNYIGNLVFQNDIKIAKDILKTTPPLPLEKLSGHKIIAETLYLVVDSAMVQTREPLEKKAIDTAYGIQNTVNGIDDIDLYIKNQLEETSKGSEWKKNKLCLAFSTDNILNWTDKYGVKQYKILKKEFTALIGTALDFMEPFYSLAVRNGYYKYKNTILLSDGSLWIENIKSILFKDIIHILDYSCLCKNISNFSKDIFGTTTKYHDQWSQEICHKLKNGPYEPVIEQIESLGSRKLSKSKFNLIDYILTHKNRIKYQEYINRGFLIDSREIESANRSVLQHRFKLQGMRWEIDNAQNVATLMSKEMSHLWNSDVADAVYGHFGVKPPSLHLRPTVFGRC